jgi:hypothetical protein
MYISSETLEQTEIRLKEVIQTADLKVYNNDYYFKEIPVDKFQMEPQALAAVKDEEVWSFLVPATSQNTENFKIFSFHFKDNLDNSGFVGWLATKIKEKLGSGVFVICGQNSYKGGIFDYWGCPISIADQVIELVNHLRE